MFSISSVREGVADQECSGGQGRGRRSGPGRRLLGLLHARGILETVELQRRRGEMPIFCFSERTITTKDYCRDGGIMEGGCGEKEGRERTSRAPLEGQSTREGQRECPP